MDMRVDGQRIRAERTRRAWSQEHLASVTNLGLRTIQRIEASGMASNESVSAIASAFGVTVSEFVKPAATPPISKAITLLAAKRLWLLLGIACVALVTSPPSLNFPLAGLWLWVGIELLLGIANRNAASR